MKWKKYLIMKTATEIRIDRILLIPTKYAQENIVRILDSLWKSEFVILIQWSQTSTTKYTPEVKREQHRKKRKVVEQLTKQQNNKKTKQPNKGKETIT